MDGIDRGLGAAATRQCATDLERFKDARETKVATKAAEIAPPPPLGHFAT